MQRGCLEGLVVLEAGRGWPIAIAGRLLAELGAEVVKIEPRAGDALRTAGPMHTDGLSHAWHTTCAGKYSVAFDFESDQDRVLAAGLAGVADVILTDATTLDFLAPAVLSRADLVLAHLTLFGLQPAAKWRHGSEGVAQAAAGIMATTGFPQGRQVRAGCDLAGHVGAFFCVTAILAALLHRDHGGRGQKIDLAICDALATFLLLWLPPYFMTGRAPERQGNRHLSSVPWNAYRTADGWAMVCTSTDAQWSRLCDLIGRPDLKGGRHDKLRQRMNDVDFIDELTAQWVRSLPTRDVVERLHGIGIPAGPILDLAGMLADPHTRAREIVMRLRDHDGGEVPVAGSLVKMSTTPGTLRFCAPKLDQDRAHVRARLAHWVQRPAARALAKAPALTEIRVVESGVFGAGPFAGKLLGEFGMQVLKVEAPEGDGMRHYQPQLNDTAYPFHLYNANKRSIALDLKSPAGLARAREVIGGADVYVENLGPGAVDRLGLGYEPLQALNPGLVYCSISGFGRTGPYSGARAYDTVVQAMSGIMSLTGDELPTKIGVSAADLIGPTFAVIPVLAALVHRNRSGAGQRIDVSMYDVCAFTTQAFWPLVGRGESIGLLGNTHPFYAPYNTYATLDGHVFIGVEEDSQWAALAPLAGIDPRPYAAAAQRCGHRAEIDARIEAWTCGRSAEAVADLCQAAGAPAAPVRGIEAVMSEPRMAERGMLVHLRDAHGTELTLTGSPMKLSLTPGSVLRVGPVLNDAAAHASAWEASPAHGQGDRSAASARAHTSARASGRQREGNNRVQ